MSLNHTYARYLDSVPREKKCACGQALLGQCPVCSVQLQEKELPIDETQLSFGFMTTSNYVYGKA